MTHKPLYLHGHTYVFGVARYWNVFWQPNAYCDLTTLDRRQWLSGQIVRDLEAVFDVVEESRAYLPGETKWWNWARKITDDFGDNYILKRPRPGNVFYQGNPYRPGDAVRNSAGSEVGFRGPSNWIPFSTGSDADAGGNQPNIRQVTAAMSIVSTVGNRSAMVRRPRENDISVPDEIAENYRTIQMALIAAPGRTDAEIRYVLHRLDYGLCLATLGQKSARSLLQQSPQEAASALLDEAERRRFRDPWQTS